MGLAGDLFVVRRQRCFRIASSSLRDLTSQDPTQKVGGSECFNSPLIFKARLYEARKRCERSEQTLPYLWTGVLRKAGAKAVTLPCYHFFSAQAGYSNPLLQ